MYSGCIVSRSCTGSGMCRLAEGRLPFRWEGSEGDSMEWGIPSVAGSTAGERVRASSPGPEPRAETVLRGSTIIRPHACDDSRAVAELAAVPAGYLRQPQTLLVAGS